MAPSRSRRSPGPREPLSETLTRSLRDQRLLLLLDNLEHLLPAAPGIVDLLAACPRVTLACHQSSAAARLRGAPSRGGAAGGTLQQEQEDGGVEHARGDQGGLRRRVTIQVS
jgi:hypothetical protein